MEDVNTGAPHRMTLGEWLSRRRYWLLAGVAAVLAILLFEALRALTQEFNYGQVVLAIQETTGTQHTLAILATAVSFLTLTGYDWCALRARRGYDPRVQTLRPSAATSTIAGPERARLTADPSPTHGRKAGLTLRHSVACASGPEKSRCPPHDPLDPRH